MSVQSPMGTQEPRLEVGDGQRRLWRRDRLGVEGVPGQHVEGPREAESIQLGAHPRLPGGGGGTGAGTSRL